MLTLHRQNVTVSREVLQKKLAENLETHSLEFAEALADYKKLCVAFAEQLIQEVHAGNFTNVLFKIQEPRNHIKKYEDIIEMLQYSTQDTIELDAASFNAYIKNEWDWTASFKTYASSLKGG